MQRALGLVLSAVVVAASIVTASNMLGGAKDAKIDAHTQEVASFAVAQLQHKANFPIQGTLKLSKVVSAKTQVCTAVCACRRIRKG